MRLSLPRTLVIDGLANARDLGGLRRADGTRSPTEVFIRAETLDRVTPRGWEQLWNYGVRTVIDLHRPAERSGETPSTIRRIDVDLDGDDEEFWMPFEADGRWGTPLYYVAHVHRQPDRLADVLEAIASAEDGGILFHCGAGWDRTGLVSAVLLQALDVIEDDATADYVASFSNAQSMASLHERSFEVDERREILDRFGHTPESAFRSAYQGLNLDRWFEMTDMSEEDRRAITTWRGAAPASRS